MGAGTGGVAGPLVMGTAGMWILPLPPPVRTTVWATHEDHLQHNINKSPILVPLCGVYKGLDSVDSELTNEQDVVGEFIQVQFVDLKLMKVEVEPFRFVKLEVVKMARQ